MGLRTSSPRKYPLSLKASNSPQMSVKRFCQVQQSAPHQRAPGLHMEQQYSGKDKQSRSHEDEDVAGSWWL